MNYLNHIALHVRICLKLYSKGIDGTPLGNVEVGCEVREVRLFAEFDQELRKILFKIDLVDWIVLGIRIFLVEFIVFVCGVVGQKLGEFHHLGSAVCHSTIINVLAVFIIVGVVLALVGHRLQVGRHLVDQKLEDLDENGDHCPFGRLQLPLRTGSAGIGDELVTPNGNAIQPWIVGVDSVQEQLGEGDDCYLQRNIFGDLDRSCQER